MAQPARPARELLDAGGPFEAHLPGFAPRAGQQRLAEAIEATLTDGGTLVAEAGTGIGKTLAYLVPVLEQGGRTIISTGTKTLQDQLFFRDLPLVQKALGRNPRSALLKGRGNYLCLYRMQRTREEGLLASRDAVRELEAVHAWSAQTTDGDLSLTPVLRADSPLWPQVTSTADNCLGSACPRFDECHVARARKRAQEADVVVVNHHLLFADMAVRQRGFGEVLPGAEAFIVDEAHQAPETAAQFFSSGLSVRQVSDWCDDLLAEAGQASGALKMVQEPVAECQQALKALQAAAAEHLGDRGSWSDFLSTEPVRDGLRRLDETLAGMQPLLEDLGDASRGLESCARRQGELLAVLDQLDAADDQQAVRWYERRGRGFALHLTPLDIADTFREFRADLDARWVFTSATLAVREDFGHFSRRLGLDEPDTLQVDSPFDYPNQALMWLPEHLPEPREPDFVPRLLDEVRPLIEASGGRAFLLFTSHRALREAAEQLQGDLDYPLFVQGEYPRSLLLEQFREAGNGVLLGSASFWQGVDVIGDALSLVVIDKLPFAAPDDPVTRARADAARRAGENPFMSLALPQAVIALKQGAGRLIRDVNDRGALVICDPRLRSRGYGEVFLASLPPMRRAASRDELVAFFADAPAGD